MLNAATRPAALARRAVWLGVLLTMAWGGCKPRQLVFPTPQMDVEPRFWVRVLLLDDVRQCSLVPTSPLDVGRATGHPRVAVAQARFRRSAESIRVTIDDGRITVAGRTLGGDVLVSPDEPYVFSLNGDVYRGTLRLIPNPDGETFDAVNFVPLEPYLAGVVGSEMPDYWEPEALKAQAVVARTYCLYIKGQFGKNRAWDVSRTQASQVYGGAGAESEPVWKAVRDTHGKVLVDPSSAALPSDLPIFAGGSLFPTYYHSSCGGHTEDSQNVFGDSFGPLGGVSCPYCQDVARLNVFFWPTARFPKAEVQRKLFAKYPTLKALGRIRRITVVKKSEHGAISRMTSVRLEGDNGKSDTVRGEDLRLTIDPSGRKIRSTVSVVVDWGSDWAFVSGRGWGHGVGMCQCGAEGMARSGSSAEAILQHYYPGSRTVSVY